MARWRILDGPNKRPPDKDFTDGDVWAATIENVNDPAQRRIIVVMITRSVLQSDATGLDREVREAVESNGRSAIEKYLGEQEPPERVTVSSSGVTVAD